MGKKRYKGYVENGISKKPNAACNTHVPVTSKKYVACATCITGVGIKYIARATS